MTPARKDPWFRNRLIRDGIYRAIHARMETDPRVILLGEGSHMKVHFDCPAIEKDFPDRVLTMPISEDANTNFAVGLALGGVIPIVDVISSDFLYRTMDSICNTCRTVNYVADEPYTIVIRAEFLTGGPTTGQRIEGLFCGIPGLHVAVPSRSEDAEVMMTAALNRKGVTVFFEDRTIEDATAPADDGEKDGEVVPHGARFRRRGSKVTVVSYGYMARQLEVWLKDDERVELIDLRWLKPLDMPRVRASVAMTGALLGVESGSTAIVGSRVIAAVAITEIVGRAHVEWLCGTHATIPAARELHEGLMPSQEQVRKTIDRLLEGAAR